jgi:hypothetical protein
MKPNKRLQPTPTREVIAPEVHRRSSLGGQALAKAQRENTELRLQKTC